MQAGADQSSDQEDPDLREIVAQLQAHPDNVDLVARLSHQLINRREWEEANRLTERGLGLNPFHVESRIHRAVLSAARDEKAAIAALEHLTRDYPDAYEGLLFLGGLALQKEDPRKALDYFERYLADAPASEQPPRLREGMAMLRTQLGLPAQ
jgi:tetratricopeptide (TPR) repeat protein